MVYQFKEKKNDDREIVLTGSAVSQKSTKNGHTSIAYNNIKSIQLISPMQDVYSCIIRSRSGEKILFANRTFVSWGKFDIKNEEYISFLKALHEKTGVYKNIEYKSGNKGLFYFMVIAIPVLILLFLTVIILKVMGEGVRISFSKIILMTLAASSGIILIRKGKGGEYTPEELPEKFLPGN